MKAKMFSHYFASEGQMEVCSICPIFACFQPSQNDRHTNNLDKEKQTIYLSVISSPTIEEKTDKK